MEIAKVWVLVLEGEELKPRDSIQGLFEHENVAKLRAQQLADDAADEAKRPRGKKLEWRQDGTMQRSDSGLGEFFLWEKIVTRSGFGTER